MAVIRMLMRVEHRQDLGKTQVEGIQNLSILTLGAKFRFNQINPYFYKGFYYL